MNFKDNLENWLAEIKIKFEYSHIEKTFTHLFIREFRDDHIFDENEIRNHIVDNANDLGIDALYLNSDNDLILIQSKYSENDRLLSSEIEKADNFLKCFFEVEGNKQSTLLEKANKPLKTILETEIFPVNVGTVYLYYLCGNFSDLIKSSLKNIQEKYVAKFGKDFYIEFLDINTLETLYDPYCVSNKSEIHILDNKYFEIEQDKLEINGNKTGIETKACVFSAQALSLKNLYESLGDTLFDANVRNFLTFRKPINRSIKLEIEKPKSNLWYYNNGLVAICEGYEIKDGNLFATNLQIVNGGQTVRSIASVNYIAPNLGVNTKLVSIENASSLPTDLKKNFINELAVNSNRQNPINSRDLKSNDEIQREIQNKFRDFGIFFQIKAGEEKVDEWKKVFKREKRSILNATIVSAYISLFLQKTNASGGRLALAFLSQDEGDDIINYENIFGNRATVNHTFEKLLLTMYIANHVDNYRKSEEIASNFPFHFHSLNLMLSLIGYWFYLCSNQEYRNKPYDETAVREFLASSNFDISKFVVIDKNNKKIILSNPDKLNEFLNFITEQVHINLNSKQIHTNFRRIINFFKTENVVKEFADLMRPMLSLRKMYI